MKGKEKCKILKEIRAQIAAANEIAWVTEECPHKGECRGTCPKCEAEVRKLERELERRRALGKTVAVVGLSAGLIATTTACDALNDFGNTYHAPDGDMIVPQSSLSSTYVLDGDIVQPQGDLVVDGGMAPVIYPSDFRQYELTPLYMAGKSIVLYEVEETNETGEERYEIPAGDLFTLLGDNGTESAKADLFLIMYKGKLYAIDEFDMANATECITDDD